MTERESGGQLADLQDRLGALQLDLVELTSLLGSVLFDNADGIVIVDLDGRIQTVNPAAEELLGRLSGELVGQSFGYPMTPQRTTELNLVHRPSATVEMRVAQTELHGEQVFVASLRDITARKQAEDSLRNFVSTASHEFRTPITSIIGFAETLSEQWDNVTDEEKLGYVEVILRQARRLARLSQDLLSLSRLDAGPGSLERVRTRVVDVVHRAVDSVATSIEQQVFEVEVDVDPTLQVLVDPDHLEEILINYLTNARKYGALPVRVTARRDGARVKVSVVDHGPGVPAEFRPKLFQRFARDRNAHRVAPGSGLGLSIVQGLAERNGGEAWYRPAEGGGSEFGVTLVAI